VEGQRATGTSTAKGYATAALQEESREKQLSNPDQSLQNQNILSHALFLP
jgi:hypothetical protein